MWDDVKLMLVHVHHRVFTALSMYYGRLYVMNRCGKQPRVAVSRARYLLRES